MTSDNSSSPSTCADDDSSRDGPVGLGRTSSANHLHIDHPKTTLLAVGNAEAEIRWKAGISEEALARHLLELIGEASLEEILAR
ncbi:hypothetical protein [Altererythrobacter sp. MTPC7]|uniref:hypothetical protein n=1 Tax=Altererythrobacter sp. MTPC7 TaxID=3056567 RepID=UPI0036F2F558